MQPTEDREAALARSVRRQLRHAAREIVTGGGSAIDRLVRAWPYLRPLYGNAVPGQRGLNDAQRRELQWILDSMAGRRGAAANSPVIRRIDLREAEKVATRIRWLAGAVPPDSESERPPIGGRVVAGR
jgi:hypothetical protein